MWSIRELKDRAVALRHTASRTHPIAHLASKALRTQNNQQTIAFCLGHPRDCAPVMLYCAFWVTCRNICHLRIYGFPHYVFINVSIFPPHFDEDLFLFNCHWAVFLYTYSLWSQTNDRITMSNKYKTSNSESQGCSLSVPFESICDVNSRFKETLDPQLYISAAGGPGAADLANLSKIYILSMNWHLKVSKMTDSRKPKLKWSANW